MLSEREAEPHSSRAISIYSIIRRSWHFMGSLVKRQKQSVGANMSPVTDVHFPDPPPHPSSDVCDPPPPLCASQFSPAFAMNETAFSLKMAIPIVPEKNRPAPPTHPEVQHPRELPEPAPLRPNCSANLPSPHGYQISSAHPSLGVSPHVPDSGMCRVHQCCGLAYLLQSGSVVSNVSRALNKRSP